MGKKRQILGFGRDPGPAKAKKFGIFLLGVITIINFFILGGVVFIEGGGERIITVFIFSNKSFIGIFSLLIDCAGSIKTVLLYFFFWGGCDIWKYTRI